jgi:catechol 2,3-dioxygenase-like lactoylglutathione lyase family enzyme
MFSHVTIGTNNIHQAQNFYGPVLKTLGHSCFSRSSSFLAYGKLAGAQIWLIHPFDGKEATIGNGIHIALIAIDRQSVDNFHATALELGGTNEGSPGLRIHYHKGYYGAYIRDPEGNKLQAVCHKNIDY